MSLLGVPHTTSSFCTFIVPRVQCTRLELGIPKAQLRLGGLSGSLLHSNQMIRRSMQTLRARCRKEPHLRMVVDALTKRHGNSITRLRQLRDGVLSIVDEDQELAMRETCREKHHCNVRPYRQVGNVGRWWKHYSDIGRRQSKRQESQRGGCVPKLS